LDAVFSHDGRLQVVKLGCGAAMVLFGVVLLIWIFFNLFIQRQAEFKSSIFGFGFLVALLMVGSKWIYEGREAMKEQSRPKRRKKKRPRPIDEDEE
jgi:heme/copper-type cytochrome/quinol oxidase subunit 4